MTPNDTQRHFSGPNLGLLGARALCHPTRPNRAKAPVLSDLFARSGAMFAEIKTRANRLAATARSVTGSGTTPRSRCGNSPLSASIPRRCATTTAIWRSTTLANTLFEGQVRLKKYFYVLRALLAIRYIESERGIPPVR